MLYVLIVVFLALSLQCFKGTSAREPTLLLLYIYHIEDWQIFTIIVHKKSLCNTNLNYELKIPNICELTTENNHHKNIFSFIQGLTDIYGNGIQKFVYDTCVEAFGETQCKKQGFTTSSVFAVDGPNLSIGEELLAMFAVGTAAMIIVLSNEVLY